MRAELEASLCVPEDNPIDLKIDPVQLHALLSEVDPSLTVAPLKLDLPTTQVTIPDVTVKLPAPTITATVRVALDTDALFDYLTRWQNLLNNAWNPLAVPPTIPAPGDLLIALSGPGIAAAGLPLVMAPDLKISITVDLGQVEVGFDKPLTVALGDLALASAPDPQHQPMTVELKVPSISFDASVGPLNAELDGCVVLNGGQPQCSAPAGQFAAAAPSVMNATADPAPPPPGTPPGAPTGVSLTIRGQGFGAQRGHGSVRLKGPGGVGTHSPVDYEGWDDGEISASFQPSPPAATYAVLVTSASGVDAEPGSVTLG